MQNVDELLEHALAIELEAAERYAELAAQMEMHNNARAAAFFRRMAHVEGLHAGRLQSRGAGRERAYRAPWEQPWTGVEPPESIDPIAVSYLLGEREALALALAAEHRAAEFFEGAARRTQGDVLDLARELAAEEREHVRLVEAELARLPPADRTLPDDPDPPVFQD